MSAARKEEADWMPASQEAMSKGMPVDNLFHPAVSFVMIGDCYPLLGPLQTGDPSLSRIVADANGEADAVGDCLLRPDQLRQLSQAWVEQDMFPTADHSTHQRQSLKVVGYIKEHYPDYYQRFYAQQTAKQ